MISTNGGAFVRLVAGGAAAATALAGFTIGLAAPAHAAVTISGSTIDDAAGNYVDGSISVYNSPTRRRRHDRLVRVRLSPACARRAGFDLDARGRHLQVPVPADVDGTLHPSTTATRPTSRPPTSSRSRAPAPSRPGPRRACPTVTGPVTTAAGRPVERRQRAGCHAADGTTCPRRRHEQRHGRLPRRRHGRRQAALLRLRPDAPTSHWRPSTTPTRPPWRPPTRSLGAAPTSAPSTLAPGRRRLPAASPRERR